MVLTVTLNPAIDKIIWVKNFSIGKDFRADHISLSAGGKGLNVSRALKSLGQKSNATGFLAGASGQWIASELHNEKIDCDFLTIPGQTRTNLTILDSKTKKITRLLGTGPAVDFSDWKKFKSKFTALIKNCYHVIFSGSQAAGLHESCYAELISIARRKGIKTVLDTSGKPLLLGLKAKPFMVKPNLEEAQSIVGYQLNSTDRIKKAIKYFHGFGIENVIISLGEKGAMASDGETILRAIAPKILLKNNVGCGDALAGGFIYADACRYDFATSFRYSVACSCANLLSVQPGSLQRKDTERLLGKIIIKGV